VCVVLCVRNGNVLGRKEQTAGHLAQQETVHPSDECVLRIRVRVCTCTCAVVRMEGNNWHVALVYWTFNH